MYRCFLCRKLKLDKHDNFVFTAQDENGVKKEYKEKICTKCGDEIEKYGVLDDGIEVRDLD
jgi:hypothetical protein